MGRVSLASFPYQALCWGSAPLEFGLVFQMGGLAAAPGPQQSL